MSDILTPAAIREAMKEDDTHVREVLRALVRRDLYSWVKIVTCWNEPQNLMDKDTFYESCQWLQWVVTTKKRGLFEDPRGHIKTTRSTRGVTGWYAIQRPHVQHDHPAEFDRASEFLERHPHMRGPDGRIVIGSDSKERAADFVGSTKTDWETNALQRWLFPELLWPNYNRLPYGEWSRTSYTLNGRLNAALPDPFITAVGLDSKVQGGRAEGIMIDDLVGETSYKSAAELDRRKNWSRTVGFLLENRDYEHPDGGFILVIGNRWSLDDVNSDIHNHYQDWAIWHRSAYRCMVHGASNCGRWDDSTSDRECADSDEPLWKGRYPDAEALDRVERDVGAQLFAAQFRNDPTAEAELDSSNFRFFHLDVAPVRGVSGPLERKWSIIAPEYDPEGNPISGKEEIIPIESLASHLISIDPASSKDERACRTVASWFGYDKPTGRVFNLDYAADRFSPEEAINAIFALYVRSTNQLGQGMRILCEKVAAQAYVGAALKFKGLHEKIRIPDVEMIPPVTGVAKDDRIRRRVGNRLNQGLLYIRAGLQLPKYEVRHFPTGTKDWLDTEAQAEEIFLEIMGVKNSDRLTAARKRKRRRRLMAARDSATGVGV